MTKPTSAASNPGRNVTGRNATGRSAGGFTLVELLVVIGIIVLLMSIALPMINRAYRSADRARMAMDLQALTTALEEYRKDHGDYPRFAPNDPSNADMAGGARLLCRALIAPGPAGPANIGDGFDGPGFRTRPGGKPWGPYLQGSQFTASTTDQNAVILDRYRKPVLYFPAQPGNTNVSAANAYVAQSPAARYNANDNLAAFGRAGNNADALKRIRLVLGDHNANGAIETGEAAVSKPFLLWSAGPDEIFGPDNIPTNPSEAAAEAARCDDVTNFR